MCGMLLRTLSMVCSCLSWTTSGMVVVVRGSVLPRTLLFVGARGHQSLVARGHRSLVVVIMRIDSSHRSFVDGASYFIVGSIDSVVLTSSSLQSIVGSTLLLSHCSFVRF